MKLNLGCGNVRKDGFVNIDRMKTDATDVVADVFEYLMTLGNGDDPVNDGVDEVEMIHFLEHLDGPARVALMNELSRVMKVGGKIHVISPNWSTDMAYGDPTHAWPPMSAWSFYYMDKNWRDVSAPHCGYTCNFKPVINGRSTAEPWFLGLSDEQKASRMRDSVNTAILIEATLTKE